MFGHVWLDMMSIEMIWPYAVTLTMAIQTSLKYWTCG